MGRVTADWLDKKYPELSIALNEFNDCGVIEQLGFVQARAYTQTEDPDWLLDLQEIDLAIDQAVQVGLLTSEEARRIKTGEMTEDEAHRIQEREEFDA